MEKTIILLVVLMALLILFTTLLFASTIPKSSFSNNLNIYSHTKAICNAKNFCQDYHVFCADEKVVKMFPITGAAVQFSNNWKDSRDKETINNMC